MKHTIAHECGHCIGLPHIGGTIMATYLSPDLPGYSNSFPTSSGYYKLTGSATALTGQRIIGPVREAPDSDSSGPHCPDHGETNPGPTTRSSVRAPVWGPDYYESQYLYESSRDYYSNPREEFPLNLTYLTRGASPSVPNNWATTQGETGFRVVSVSPSLPTGQITYSIANVSGEMKLCIRIYSFYCGTYTFVIRARNSAGYADVNYTLELKYLN